jgi:DNA-binding transcriptional LysR family regulator
MDRFIAMQVFVEIAERGSLTEAGDALEMSRAMVSRYLESLEQWLGVRLLHRTTRRVSLTDAGAEALQGCRQVVELTRDVRATAGARHREPSGRLRIAASPSFAQACLADAIADFLALYPRTQIELLVQERTVNLVEERIDLAVRIGNQLDESLVARRLGTCQSALCASPGYVAKFGAPASPDALGTHRFITHAYVGRTELRLRRGGELVKVPVSGVLQTNEPTVGLQAALRGTGIALLPTYLVNADLLEGKLVRVLPDCEPEAMGIHAVYLSRQHQPQLLRSMLDHLAHLFKEEIAPWDRALVVDGPSKPVSA